MITPSHLIYSWALGRYTDSAEQPRRIGWFILGGLLPDLPIYVFFIVHGLLLGTSGALMWNEMYFDSAWTPFFLLSHSWLLWPTLYAVGRWLQLRPLQWVATTATIHTIMDFFVHHDDAYAHFWPLSDWKWFSSFSYWDPQYFGNYVGVVDSILILALLYWLYQHPPTQTKVRAIILFVGICYSGLALSGIVRILM